MHESQILMNILNKNEINYYPGGTDKGNWHTYTGMYERLLTPFLEKESLSLLEIGVQAGGSAVLWHDFMPNAQLYLVDISDQRNPEFTAKLNHDRYKFYEMDAYDLKTCEYISKENIEGYDIIIDDGPHTLESQIECIKLYIPLLKPGGVMIIEDLQDISWTQTLMNYVPEELKKNVEVLDVRHVKGRYDDIAFIIKKPG